MYENPNDPQAGQRANSCRRTVEPGDPVITLQEAREHLRLDAIGSPGAHPDDDLVLGLIATATDELDGWEGNLGRCLMPQTWEYRAPYFSPCEMLIPLPPLRSVTSVKYLDESGAEQTLDPASYRVILETSRPGFIIPSPNVSAWPGTLVAPDAVRIVFTAGYDDAAAIPAPIKSWIKLRLGQLYDNREAVIVGTIVSALPQVDALIDRYKIRGVFQ